MIDSVIDTFARTIYGEARGEGFLGMQAVANVIMNRVNSGKTWWGKDLRGVCLAPWQFSCWNKGDPNLSVIQTVDETNRLFRGCLDMASKAANGLLPDITYGATSYYDRRMSKPPVWSEGITPCASIGNHLLYKI